MTTSPDSRTDFLIAAGHEVRTVHGWANQLLTDGGVADDQNHRPSLDDLSDAVSDLDRALREFTEYSDGRPIQASVEIEPDRGHFFSYVFKPVPEHRGERLLCESPRPGDPEEGDRGTYKVWVDDRAASIRIELLDPQTGRDRHLGVVR